VGLLKVRVLAVGGIPLTVVVERVDLVVRARDTAEAGSVAVRSLLTVASRLVDICATRMRSVFE
jgi:hypothetical protein